MPTASQIVAPNNSSAQVTVRPCSRQDLELARCLDVGGVAAHYGHDWDVVAVRTWSCPAEVMYVLGRPHRRVVH